MNTPYVFKTLPWYFAVVCILGCSSKEFGWYGLVSHVTVDNVEYDCEMQTSCAENTTDGKYWFSVVFIAPREKSGKEFITCKLTWPTQAELVFGETPPEGGDPVAVRFEQMKTKTIYFVDCENNIHMKTYAEAGVDNLLPLQGGKSPKQLRKMEAVCEKMVRENVKPKE